MSARSLHKRAHQLPQSRAGWLPGLVCRFVPQPQCTAQHDSHVKPRPLEAKWLDDVQALSHLLDRASEKLSSCVAAVTRWPRSSPGGQNCRSPGARKWHESYLKKLRLGWSCKRFYIYRYIFIHVRVRMGVRIHRPTTIIRLRIYI